MVCLTNYQRVKAERSVSDREGAEHFVLCTLSHNAVISALQMVHEFNSTVLSIQRDIDTLTKFAAVNFDGLPKTLVPVLSSIETTIMPKRWRTSRQRLQPIPLDQGLQGQSSNTNDMHAGTHLC